MNFTHRVFEPSTLWMISPEHLAFIAKKVQALQFGNTEQSKKKPLYNVRDGVAVIDIAGTIVRTAEEWETEYFGLCSLEEKARAIDQANSDTGVSAILLSIDSPGGEACGTPEMSDLVAESKKPVAAWTGGMMASAAYYIGSQARYVSASKSAYVGSVGCVMTTYDWSGYLEQLGIKANVFTDSPLKAAGHPAKPLSKEQREYLQGLVDEIGGAFRAAVKAKRPGAEDSAMQGQVLLAPSARDAGLIDEIGTMGAAIRAAAALRFSK